MTSDSPTRNKVTIEFDDRTPRWFMIASIGWGVVAMLVGVIIAFQLNFWQVNGKIFEWLTFGWFRSEGVEFLTFGRLRPLHTNAAIFAFVGNMMFSGVYYSTQRLCNTAPSPTCSRRSTSGAGSSSSSSPPFPARRPHPWQGIRRTDLADQPHGRGDLGRLRAEFLPHSQGPPRTVALRRPLVLYRHDHHGGDALYRQPPPDPHEPCPQLPGLRRRAGRPRAVVVRAQRRRLLPHHAHPRDHVLLHAQGGEPARLFLPALHRPLLVARLHLHLGGTAPPPQHRAAAVAPDPRDVLLADALGTFLGRHDQRPPHPAREPGTSCAPIR